MCCLACRAGRLRRHGSAAQGPACLCAVHGDAACLLLTVPPPLPPQEQWISVGGMLAGMRTAGCTGR